MTTLSFPRDFSGGRLRRLHPRDLDAFQAYRALPELGRYQGWSPMPNAEALAFLREMHEVPGFANGQWLQLGIAEPDSDVLVGDIGIYLSEEGADGEIGFTLHPSSQGRGIAGRAVREALQLFFAATRANRILGITDERNVPSIRLLERAGFALVEIRQVEFRGQPCTERVYALTRHSSQSPKEFERP